MRSLLYSHPIIAAVRKPEDMARAIESPARVIFVLTGDINTLGSITESLQAAGKQAFLHLDLIQGFGSDRSAMRFIAQQIRPAGIITTKSHLIRNGKEEGLVCIQRTFVFDHQSLTTAVTQSRTSAPAALEVMPGVLPDWILSRLVSQIKLPVIAGGLISTREEMARILSIGVAGVSIGSPDLWFTKPSDLSRLNRPDK